MYHYSKEEERQIQALNKIMNEDKAVLAQLAKHDQEPKIRSWIKYVIWIAGLILDFFMIYAVVLSFGIWVAGVTFILMHVIPRLKTRYLI